MTRTSGDAHLVVTPCAGGAAITLPLAYSGGRWNAGLDTGPLAGACQTVTATIDGLVGSSFQLDLRGAEPLKATKTKGK